MEEALAAIDGGRAEAAFLLRPPQKSTYFFPKLLSGLLIQPLD